MRHSSMVLFVVLLCTSPHAAAADTVRDLADAASPRIAKVASGIVIADWAERTGSLLASAPSASGAGTRWVAGDSHWEAAKSSLLTHVERWAADLVDDPQAREIVRQAFARNLDAAKAAALQSGLKDDMKAMLLEANDDIHLAVTFSGKHPNLQIGSPEFSKAYEEWLKSAKIGSSAKPVSAELAALLKTEAGISYDRARGAAIRSLVTGLDGQIQLLFNDAQSTLLEEIGKEARACASGH